jgi:hypothetical protein
MEDKHQSTDINDINKKIKYSKIDTNDDTILDSNEVKPQNSFPESIRVYINENGEENDKIKNNSTQKIGALNRNLSNYFYMKLGNTYTFFGDIYGNPKLIIGPHWPLYVFVTILFSLATYFVYSYFGKYINFFLKFIGIIIYLIFLISYTYTALINPGFPKHDIDSITGEPRKKFYYCNICKIWANLEKKTQHCPDCNICVEGNDHHCPWTGKCIGQKNLKSFIIFVCSVFVLFVYLIILIGTVDKSSFKKNDSQKKL